VGEQLAEPIEYAQCFFVTLKRTRLSPACASTATLPSMTAAPFLVVKLVVMNGAEHLGRYADIATQ
jgi:hypothetical protein